MFLLRNLAITALIVACCPWNTSQAGVYLGIGYGGGPGYYRPYYGRGYGYGYGYGYYRPYPLYVAPPVIVQPGPVVVQQPTVVQPAYPPPAQAPAPLPPPTPVTAAAPSSPDLMPAVATGSSNRQADVDAYVQQVQTGDETARADALVRLGRLQAERAVGPMVKALNSDASPRVREAAARGLGLIGSRSALSALQYAAQSDDNPEVRHSASFAAEVIRGR
ncbi:MAG TPA: HEAT repeat domain-containing protein [Gemmataceae bacterium]|nr:HEAT repeat domain-containing protein [Gemmataceae bacterium]